MYIAVVGRPAAASSEHSSDGHSQIEEREWAVEPQGLLAMLAQRAPHRASPAAATEVSAGCQCDAIHLAVQPAGYLTLQEAERLLSDIRATAPGALMPVIVTGASSPSIEALANQWPGSRLLDLSDVVKRQEASASAEQPEAGLSASAERLLRWWRLYPDHVLQVSLSPALMAGCEWPLLSAWGMTASEQHDLLALFAQRGWTREVTLMTRARHCRQCRSVHLNYIDVCPRCRHLDLVALDGLHCFTCGHVDRLDHFTHDERLVCPKCHVRLRHIGVDYDRPLESLACGKCDLWLVEGEVEVQCMDCGQLQQPGELIQQRVASLALSEAGRRVVALPRKEGMPEQMVGQRVSRAELHHMLDLLVPLARRHAHRHLLMVMSSGALPSRSVASPLSASSPAASLSAMAQRLTSLLRDTDLVCEYDAGHWLFLLPHTPREHFADIARRIKSLTELAEDDAGLNIALEMHELPSERCTGKAPYWLAQLLDDQASGQPSGKMPSEAEA